MLHRMQMGSLYRLLFVAEDLPVDRLVCRVYIRIPNVFISLKPFQAMSILDRAFILSILFENGTSHHIQRLHLVTE